MQLTHADLLDALHYDPATGLFTWIKGRSNVKAGSKAGSFTRSGYVEIGLKNIHYLAHRLAWFYMKGEWPIGQIDHHDMVKMNNKWTNLRVATHGQNVCNSNPRKHNKTGAKGVTRIKKSGRWHARIMSNGVLYILGNFKTREEAKSAYGEAAKKLHKEFARM